MMVYLVGYRSLVNRVSPNPVYLHLLLALPRLRRYWAAAYVVAGRWGRWETGT